MPTSTAAKNAFGAELWLAPAGGVLVKVAMLTKVSEPDLSRGTADATTHDSPGGAEEVIAEGVYKVGNIQFEGDYVALSTGDTALRLALTSGAKQDYKVVSKAATTTALFTGSGYLTKYTPSSLEVKGIQKFTGEIMPTGVVTGAAGA
jgi:hypothetical protein